MERNPSGNKETTDADKNLVEKALDGTIAAADFRSFIADYIKGQNSEHLKTTDCTLSKSQLDWNLKGNPCPVVEIHDHTYVNDSLKIFNNNKSKKIYFSIEWKDNPKFELLISPDQGEIKKGGNIDINFKMRAFCTTKVYQMIRISFSREKPKNSNSTRRSFFTTNSSQKKDVEIGHLFASLKVESELSSSIDYDEIKIGEKIGKGGYGTVYRGEWRTTEVAIKVMNIQDMVEEERESVKREIRLMSKLNYSYIVTYMGSTQTPGKPLTIIMEFVRGGTLTELLKKEQISERFKCKLSLDVARGLAFLHSHNIYHRDIKPDNMLVVSSHPDAHVNLKITDFGTSRASTFSSYKSDETYLKLDEMKKGTGPAKTDEKKMTKGMGTLIYQAPEIIRGEANCMIDKTDIYSFGVLLYEVFTRKEPYSEPPYDKMSKWEIEKFVSSGKRIEIPKETHPRIRDLIASCWNHDPLKRPDFGGIVKMLTEVMESLPIDSERPAGPAPGPAVVSETLFHDDNSIPVPNGDLNSIGWSGEIDRKEIEAKLKSCAEGTFVVRWSKKTASYVLTYQNVKLGPQHIAYIIPDQQGRVSVDRQDGKKATYESIFEYIKVMQKSGLISRPFTEIAPQQDPIYTYTPSPNNKK